MRSDHHRTLYLPNFIYITAALESLHSCLLGHEALKISVDTSNNSERLTGAGRSWCSFQKFLASFAQIAIKFKCWKEILRKHDRCWAYCRCTPQPLHWLGLISLVRFTLKVISSLKIFTHRVVDKDELAWKLSSYLCTCIVTDCPHNKWENTQESLSLVLGSH